MARFKEILVISAALFLILCLTFFDIFFLGKTFKVTTTSAQALHTGPVGQEWNRLPFIPTNGNDSAILEEPMYEFIKSNLHRGIFPLWNPHQACGFPLTGMLEAGMFFPLTLIMYLCPQVYSWDILIVSRFFLAGLLTYLFMRRLGFKKIPSLIAGSAYMLSGPMVLLQYWFANVEILTPLLLISFENLIHKPSLRAIGFSALCVGLTVLGGHPEHILFVNLYGFLFFVVRLCGSSQKGRWGKNLFRLVTAYSLGLGLSAIALFPFLRNLGTEFWSGHPPHTGIISEEQLERFITLALPHFFQQQAVTRDWTFAGWWGGYLGVLPLGLAILSLWQKQKKGMNYFFAGMAFLLLAKAYGLWFINWIGYLPLLNVCRFTAHTTHLTAFSTAVASGMGARMILLSKNTFRKALVFSTALALVTLSQLLRYKEANHFGQSIKASILAAVILAVFHFLLWLKEKNYLNRRTVALFLLTLVTVELSLYINPVHPRKLDSFPRTNYIEFLQSSPERTRAYGYSGALSPNTASAFGVDDLGIFFGLLPQRFVHFVNELLVPDQFAPDFRPTTLRSRLPRSKNQDFANLLGIQYYITPPYDFLAKRGGALDARMKKEPLELVYQHEVDIYTRPNAFPRVFVVHKVTFEADGQKAFRILKLLHAHLREGIVVNERPDQKILGLLQETPLVDDSSARIIRYTPNDVVIEADLKSPGFLVFSDAFHPDWRVRVNGKPGHVYLTDNLIRSVFLLNGKHRVEFTFCPLSFYLGRWVSLVSLIMVGILLFPRRKFFRSF